MAEHEGVKKDKKGDEDQRHRTKQQDSKPLFDQSLAWDTGPSSLTETPFSPRMEKHAAMLSSIPFAVQRNNFIMRLHQTYGNRYVQRLMESIDVQARLTVSEPGDIYEQEADRVADAVTRAVSSPVQRQEEEEEELLQGKTLVQRQDEEEELLQGKSLIQRQEEEEELQTQPDESQLAQVSDNIETRIDSARGSGQPLADNIHKPMEQSFKADFSDVRVHTDSEADALNQQLSARAFTTGQDIFFRDGEYSPGSDSGRKLIAHELTHVVQQNAGRNRGSVRGMMMQPTVGELGMANVVWRALQDDIKPAEIKKKHPGLVQGDGTEDTPLKHSFPNFESGRPVSCWMGLGLALTNTAKDEKIPDRLATVGTAYGNVRNLTEVEWSERQAGDIAIWGQGVSGHVGVIMDNKKKYGGYNQGKYVKGGKGEGVYNEGKRSGSKPDEIRRPG